MKRKRLVLGLLAVPLLAGAIAWWKGTSPPPPENDADVALPAGPKSLAAAETQEDRARRKLFGVWQDHYQGKRTLTLNEDGTGTMLVELSGLRATLFAPKLRFDLKWALAEKKLTMKTLGGDPSDKVNLILKTNGNSAEDTILELTDDQLLLLDRNGTTRYDWRRVQKDESSKE